MFPFLRRSVGLVPVSIALALISPQAMASTVSIESIHTEDTSEVQVVNAGTTLRIIPDASPWFLVPDYEVQEVGVLDLQGRLNVTNHRVRTFGTSLEQVRQWTMSGDIFTDVSGFGVGYVAGSGYVEFAMAIRGDANLDGSVDGTDAGALVAGWGLGGRGWNDGDFSADGDVDGTDAGYLVTNWSGDSSSPWSEAAHMPEPLTIGAFGLAIGGLGGYVRRRRRSG